MALDEGSPPAALLELRESGTLRVPVLAPARVDGRRPVSGDGMTKSERDMLARLVRQRARVAKSGIEGRAAELLADAEAQLAASYRFDHEAWADVVAAAQKAVDEADSFIAKRCAELGIRPEFRPGIGVGWYGRGENAANQRRAELRKVAQTRIASLAKKAKHQIDVDALERETTIVAGALTSVEAKAFLDSMPTLDALMPPITIAELERRG